MSDDTVIWSGPAPNMREGETWTLTYSTTFDKDGKPRLSSIPHWRLTAEETP